MQRNQANSESTVGFIVGGSALFNDALVAPVIGPFLSKAEWTSTNHRPQSASLDRCYSRHRCTLLVNPDRRIRHQTKRHIECSITACNRWPEICGCN